MKSIHPIRSLLIVVPSLLLLAGTLRAEEGKWQVLFDGSSLDAWQSANGTAPSEGWAIEDGAITRKDKAGYIWSKERFGDFVLQLEYKTEGNSGVFFRTDNPKDPVQTGIEIQVDRPAAAPGTHSTGALYDLLAPTRVVDKPGVWNQMVITAKDAKITVALNGEQIIEADLDDWSQAGQNPDGSKNKFKTALKDFKRDGHIGLQDHGHPVAYRNIRIQPLGTR